MSTNANPNPSKKLKLYSHPWSINARKVLMTLAEHGAEADAEHVLIMIPKGEHKQPDHIARHPFGKVPVLDDDGFVLYETRAINAYLNAKLAKQGTRPNLIPEDPRATARVDQWINIADAYFVPHAAPLIVESLFRRYLGGTRNEAAIASGRENVKVALDVADRWLADKPFLAGGSFSLADIHWMPYLEYMIAIGEGEPIDKRANVSAWWKRVSARPTWEAVARRGPQPYEANMTVDVIEKMYR